ncbi:hypothetical protein BK138_00130 [Paenibacillus rhizosphaerae]|uniref:DUF418 domain-containing protein n=1 Tax=Paenibacillus rhizosphaerae TaxID=297318 RepID=A0A1R1EZ34_9BACL|nr:DUF418 domain-containing protein [Paenibacillus rhizosphaerae]OMF57079.1 hypothetical protein BK138_00130 [Paenibacillus rhizosphaerae]
MNQDEGTKNRIAVLDALRGFAILGILLVNITSIMEAAFPSRGTLDWGLSRFYDYAVEQRFYVIFSLLFGTGFYIFISRSKARGDNAVVLFMRRLAALLVFGVAHFIFQPGEALHVYAVIGFLLIPFYNGKPAFNFAAMLAALGLSLVLGEYAVTLAMFLLGLLLGQIEFFTRIDEFVPQLRLTAWVCLALTPGAIYLQYRTFPTIWYEEGANVAGLVMAAFYVSTFLLLYRNRRIQQLLKPLAAFGRTALTNYLGQTAIIVVILFLFDLKQKVSVSETTLIALCIYAVQIPLSLLWLKRFRMGPMEWLWRLLTYGKRIPIRK